MNFVEIHLNDYASATFHLSPLEDGIYWRLMRCYYRDEKPLPIELVAIYRMVGARTPDERAAVESVIDQFFVLTADGWTQKRCEEVLQQYRQRSEQAARNARKRWACGDGNSGDGGPHDGGIPPGSGGSPEAMPQNSGGNATALPRQGEGTAEPILPITHSPSNHEEKHKATRSRGLTVDELAADGLESELATEWIAHRKRKKALLTPAAWAGIKSEAAKAGWTPEKAVRKCLARGWTGFEAAWVAEAGAKVVPIKNGASILEQHNLSVVDKLVGGGQS